MSGTRVQSTTPVTDHLWLMGFTLKPEADRLAIPVASDEGTFVTNFELTALPERGEARRLFAGKGPAKSEVKSNIPLEAFLYEQEHGRTKLKDLYTEKCSRVLMDMLADAAPHISKPAPNLPELAA